MTINASAKYRESGRYQVWVGLWPQGLENSSGCVSGQVDVELIAGQAAAVVVPLGFWADAAAACQALPLTTTELRMHLWEPKKNVGVISDVRFAVTYTFVE